MPNPAGQQVIDPNGNYQLSQPCIAAARFTNANPPVLSLDDGITSIARNGAGDYTLTLTNPLVAGTFTVAVTGLHNAFIVATFTNPTTTTIRVFLWDAAGAALEAGSTEFHIIRT